MKYDHDPSNRYCGCAACLSRIITEHNLGVGVRALARFNIPIVIERAASLDQDADLETRQRAECTGEKFCGCRVCMRALDATRGLVER